MKSTIIFIFSQYVSLPKLTPDNYRVSMLRSKDGDVADFKPWDFFKWVPHIRPYLSRTARFFHSRHTVSIFLYLPLLRLHLYFFLFF